MIQPDPDTGRDPSRGATAYAVSSPDHLEQVTAALETRFEARREPPAAERRSYLDTFDRRLFKRDLRLFVARSGTGRARCRVVLKSNRRQTCIQIEADSAPAFAWNLPEGRLRDELSAVIEVRRLLPLVTVETDDLALRILNSDEKTVARVVLRRGVARAPEAGEPARPLPRTLRILPVRGYPGAARRIRSFLESDLALPLEPYDLYRDGMGSIARDPAPRGIAPDITLAPDLTAEEAARLIHGNLLAAIAGNEPGVRDDLDAEFLHDFRVAVRRTRGALAQLKAVFAPSSTRHFAAEFKWLGGVTGPVRDLDVYLEKMAEYRAALPPTVGGDLAPLQDYLVRHRREERRRLLAALDSPRYRTLLADWRAFLDGPPANRGANSSRAIRELAAECIGKAHRRVHKHGQRIHPASPADALHELRIDCKRLRYLLEFFRSLYDRKDICRLVGALKRLQDNLGNFNDLSVQQERLQRYAEEMVSERSVPAACLLAMGRLVAELGRRQSKERSRFETRFARFDAPDNRTRLRDLSNPTGHLHP